MADKEVLEGNRLIATFMNYGGGANDEYNNKPFDYHLHWNFLMPVVEKIYSMQKGKWHDKTRGVAVDIWLSMQEKIDIQKTWQEVVKAVQFYNQINK